MIRKIRRKNGYEYLLFSVGRWPAVKVVDGRFARVVKVGAAPPAGVEDERPLGVIPVSRRDRVTNRLYWHEPLPEAR